METFDLELVAGGAFQVAGASLASHQQHTQHQGLHNTPLLSEHFFPAKLSLLSLFIVSNLFLCCDEHCISGCSLE